MAATGIDGGIDGGNATGGGGGVTPVYPVLAIATTAESIRDRAIAVIGALVPRSHTTRGYRKYDNEGSGDFVAWVAASPSGGFRRFQVRQTGDSGPAVSNTDYEERQLVLAVTIAYPQDGRAGRDQAMDRDDMIDADFKQLDFAVGLYGRANFSPPNPDAMPLGATKTIVKGDGVDFLVIELTFTYQRLTS